MSYLPFRRILWSGELSCGDKKMGDRWDSICLVALSEYGHHAAEEESQGIMKTCNITHRRNDDFLQLTLNSANCKDVSTILGNSNSPK